VTEEAVALSWHGEPGPLARMLGVEEDFVGPFETPEQQRLTDVLREAFLDHPRISLDDEPVRPSFESVVFPEDLPDADGWLVVEVRLRIPVQGTPRRIAVLWERFEGTEWGGERVVPITFRHGRLPEVASVWPEEPELVWHAPPPVREDAAPVVLPAPPAPKPRWRVPAASLAALAAGGALGLGLRRRSSAAALGVLVVAGVVAAAARSRWVVPLGAAPPRPPTEAEALAIFDDLHAGLYRAFEARTEDEIYDRLRSTVAPALVDPMYADVYESLVLREQGGAVCAVEGVDVRERSASLGPEATRFEVEAAWDVRGVVSHWGHIHRRRNTYRARYTIASFPEEARPDVASWKIAAVEVLRFDRVDE